MSGSTAGGLTMGYESTHGGLKMGYESTHGGQERGYKSTHCRRVTLRDELLDVRADARREVGLAP
jgi:hypothetical protein